MPSGSFLQSGGTSAGEIRQLHPGEFRVGWERSRRWREEQKLLIDSSRYIKPVATPSLVQTELPAPGIILPSYEVQRKASDWFTGIALIAFITVAFVRMSFGKYLRSLFLSTLNYPASLRLFREQNISLKQGALLMEFFFHLVVGLFGFQVMEFYGITFPVSDFLKFLICFGAILVFFLLKSSLYSLLGFVNESHEETSEYLFHEATIKSSLFFCFVYVFAWTPEVWYFLAGLVMTFIFYLFTLNRGIKILMKKQFSVFYLFLYLCTLEFLPILLFLKVI